ncbi:hypothetical protein [Planococcus lenghuensis]|uniref:hypothetical protein n=1 Tax=Planococcus lenghuensis TaxID=2213202 RepID=UPI0012EB9B78|nr:hypothetical protein [Planococcus lenghuensis]
MKKTCEIIRPGGKFLLYQTFFQKDEYLKEHLERYFSTVEDKIFYRNVPPLRVYEATK